MPPVETYLLHGKHAVGKQRDVFLMVPFYECSKCGYVQQSDKNWTKNRKTCSRCKQTSKFVFIWPGSRKHEDGCAADVYYTLIQDVTYNSSGERNVAGILLCALAEYLLDTLCYRLIRFQKGSKEHAKIILTNADARWKLEKLFATLTGKELGGVMISANQKSFWDAWRQVIQWRNDFAHGSPEVPGDLTDGQKKQRVYTFEVCAHNMLTAFVAVHNALMNKPLAKS